MIRRFETGTLSSLRSLSPGFQYCISNEKSYARRIPVGQHKMDVEFPSVLESEQNFLSKINAADFFIDQIKNLYEPNAKIPRNIPAELYYYVDATIFELHAASQILLQIVNVKSGVKQRADKVNGGRVYQDLLKKTDNKLFEWWNDFNTSPKFHILEAMRQYISHRGGIFLQAEINENGDLILLTIPIRFRYYKEKPELKITDESAELVDELTTICLFLNLKYTELQKF